LDLERPLSRDTQVTVRTANGHLLAEGKLQPVRGGWGPQHRGGPISGQGQGELRIAALAGRGVIAPPFPEFFVVRVTRGAEPASGGIVTVESDGGQAVMAENGSINSLGNASGTITTTSREASIRLRASASNRSGTLTAALPTVPGAMWLDPEGLSEKPPRLRIVSPVAAAIAYVTIADDTARLWGGSVALEASSRAAADGTIDWPLTSSADGPAGTARPAWVTISPDVRAESALSVGWPILIDNKMRPLRPSDALDERRFSDMVLLDGMPDAEAHEATMRYVARLLGLIGTVAGLALSALLVLEKALSSMLGRARLWALYGCATTVGLTAVGVVGLWLFG
jgi:hypothetical protein